MAEAQYPKFARIHGSPIWVPPEMANPFPKKNSPPSAGREGKRAKGTKCILQQGWVSTIPLLSYYQFPSTKPPRVFCRSFVLRTRICKHIAPPEGEEGKKGKCQFQGVHYREPS